MPKQSDENLEEEWRDIPGHPGYQASRLGQIRSVERVVRDRNGRQLRQKGKLLLPWRNSSGYPSVSTADRRTCTVHSLVAAAFIGPRPAGMEINHIDGDIRNACVENLEYVTAKQNSDHAVANGLKARQVGESNGNCRFSEEQVIGAVARYRSGVTAMVAAEEFSITKNVIYAVVAGRIWKHLGLATPKVRDT